MYHIASRTITIHLDGAGHLCACVTVGIVLSLVRIPQWLQLIVSGGRKSCENSTPTNYQLPTTTFRKSAPAVGD